MKQAPKNKFLKKSIALAVSSVSCSLCFAESPPTPQNDVIEEVIVFGALREAVKSSIQLKRESSTIVDGISTKDIGALPDLSVGETLERITGVTSERFKGTSTELSVRGLSAWLTTSTYNGRAIPSPSGNRNVVFTQFPSELINTVAVHKTQQASLLEGGVAGTIGLSNIRPIEYGKRLVQVDLTGNYNLYEDRIKGHNGLGHRLSASYVDSIELNNGGALGYSIGFALSDGSTPEESYNTWDSRDDCNSDAVLDDRLGSNCNFSDDNTVVADGTARIDNPYYIAPTARFYRSMATEETRDALIGVLQYQPNDDIDITFDVLWADRYYNEDKRDFFLDEARRGVTNWSATSNHAITDYSGYSRLGTYSEFRERDEIYKSAGLNLTWQVNEKLELDADLSYADTWREQYGHQARLRSGRIYYDLEFVNNDFPQIAGFYSDDYSGTRLPNDGPGSINDIALFNDNARARDFKYLREDTINAFRLAGTYELDSGILESIEAGVRITAHDHNAYGQDRITTSTNDDMSPFVTDCMQTGPISENYGALSSLASSPVDLSQWAQFDAKCAYDAIVAQVAPDLDSVADPTAPSDDDVLLTEDLTSLFVQVNFATDWGDIPVVGNAGIRVVETETTSKGFVGQSYNLVRTGAGTELDPYSFSVESAGTSNNSQSFKNTYTNVLPSINLNLGLYEDIDLRLGLYRGISRPDMWWMGSGRRFGLTDQGDDEFSTADEAAEALRLRARGNYRIEAVESDNFDISVEWYPMDETQLSAAIYHKTFNAQYGTETGPTESIEVTAIDGSAGNAVINTNTYEYPVEDLLTIEDKKASITGIELIAKHTFTSLPSPWDGLGLTVGVNFADSSFKIPENNSGFADDIKETLKPGGMPGFSKNTRNLELFWEKDKLSTRLSYKYRSRYIKRDGTNLSTTNRYIQGHGGINASIEYSLSENFSFKFQAFDILNKPYIEERAVADSYGRIDYNGTKYFAGIKYKL